MTGLELTAKIYAKEIENGTKIKVKKTNGETVYIHFREDKLNWETGTFGTGYLFDKNVKFEIVEKEKGWFKPKHGEKYWYLDYDGDIYGDNFGSDFWGDKYKLEIHNCFRSEEEAWEYKEYKEALRKAEKPFDMSRDNFRMYYSFTSKKICLEPSRYTKAQGATYLGTNEEVAQAFIDEWKDCILKYEFDIWE